MTRLETEHTSPSGQSSSSLWEVPDRLKQISLSSLERKDLGSSSEEMPAYLTVFQVRSSLQGSLVLWSEKLLMIWEHRVWVRFRPISDLMAPPEEPQPVWGFGNILPSPQMTPALLPWESCESLAAHCRISL